MNLLEGVSGLKIAESIMDDGRLAEMSGVGTAIHFYPKDLGNAGAINIGIGGCRPRRALFFDVLKGLEQAHLPEGLGRIPGRITLTQPNRADATEE